MIEKKKLAVVGAGLSGMTVASNLCDVYEVTVFEKSRGVGGRMSTRKADDYAFDHGAQYFTVKDERFEAFIEQAITNNAVTTWHDQIQVISGIDDQHSHANYSTASDKFISSPTMTALCKSLLERLTLHRETQITAISCADENWTLTDQSGQVFGPFDMLVLSMPHPQLVTLARDYLINDDALEQVKMSGCFSLMIGDPELSIPDFSVARVVDSPVGWIAVNSEKPGRESKASMIIQSTNEWAEQNFELPSDSVKTLLMSELAWLTGKDYSHAEHISLHRWRYAFVDKSYGKPYYYHPELPLAACGDWCLGPRIESAYLSGLELAEELRTNQVKHD